MRNVRFIKAALQALNEYQYKRKERAIAKYHGRYAEIGLEAMKTMGRPIGVMVTFWLKDGATKSQVSEALKEFYRNHESKDSRHEILTQWVQEWKEETPDGKGGWHYHAAVCLDFSKVRMGSLIKALHQIRNEKNLIKSFWLSREDEDGNPSLNQFDRVKEHELLTEEGWLGYLKHMEYPSKLRTKVRAKGQRNTGGSQVTRLKEWFVLFPAEELATA